MRVVAAAGPCSISPRIMTAEVSAIERAAAPIRGGVSPLPDNTDGA